MIGTNEATWDRLIRALAGGAMATAVVGAGYSAWWATLLVTVGLLLIIMGSIGWCPVYELLGVSTVRHDPSTRSEDRIREAA